MDSARLSPNRPDMLSSGSVNSSGSVYPHSACGPGCRHSSLYGRFSVAHAEPAYFVNSFMPGMSQARGFFPPERFGPGISSVGNVTGNLYLHNQPAMAPSFTPYYRGPQELGGLGMNPVYWPYGWAATATEPVNAVAGGSGQSASPGKVKRNADTSESNARQAGPEHKVRKKRTNFPDWKVQELNDIFQYTKYVTAADRYELASRLDMSEHQVKMWFQNKRIKTRNQSIKNVEKSNRDGYMEAPKEVSQTFLANQQISSVSWQDVDAKKRYTLFCEKEIVSTTQAKSPVDALQNMIVKFDGTPQVRSTFSVADCSQSKRSVLELPVDISTRQPARDDDESDSHSSTSPGSSESLVN